MQIKIYDCLIFFYTCSSTGDFTKTETSIVNVKKFVKIIKNWAEKDGSLSDPLKYFS